jgi:hypothetical protein
MSSAPLLRKIDSSENCWVTCPPIERSSVGSSFLTNDERVSQLTVPGVQFVTSLERAPL